MKTNYALKTIGILAVSAGLSFSVSAEVLQPDQALERAFSETGTPMKVKQFQGKTPTLMLAEKDSSGQPAVYLFNMGGTQGSYMLVSAESIAPALLGYGENDAVNITEISPEFQWWISEYARQIEWARAHGVSTMSVAREYSFASIEPKVKTEWNQSAPYNNMCPTYQGSRCVTGCVATAMSQIMNYYQWPKQPTGSVSYTTTTDKLSVSVDFSKYTFDWDNMLDVYTSSATTAQNNAVATLMYCVGAGAEMDYTPNSSGATDVDMANALVKYFGYQDGIISYQRDYYPMADWESLVYDELQNGPVYYSGSSNSGGHAFVCDGYSGDGYFHINWGWGGMSNGYFLLSALDPPAQGIGGSASGYNFGQSILGGVKPNDGRAVQEVIPVMVAYGFTCTASTNYLYAIQFTDPIYGMTAPEIESGTIGIQATNSNGKSTFLQSKSFSSLPIGYGWRDETWTVSYASLSNGTYSIKPVVKTADGTVYDIYLPVGASITKSMTINNGKVTFDTTPAVVLTVTDLETKSAFYLGSYFSLSFNVANNTDGDYVGAIRPVFLNSSGNIAGLGAEYPVYLAAGESMDVSEYVSSFYYYSGTSLTSGNYNLCIIDQSGNVLSSYIPVTINSAATPSISVSNFKLVGDATNVPKNKLEFSVDVTCAKGYFANALTLVIFPYVVGQQVSSVASFSSNMLFLEAGETGTATFNGSFDDGEIGESYFAMVYNGNSALSNTQIVFTLGKEVSGVEKVEATDAEVVGEDIFSINGVKMNKDNLVPGIYIVRKTMSDGTVSTEKSYIK